MKYRLYVQPWVAKNNLACTASKVKAEKFWFAHSFAYPDDTASQPAAWTANRYFKALSQFVIARKHYQACITAKLV